MARTIRRDKDTIGSTKRRHSRSGSRKMLKDFERQYIARNKDPHIYL